MTFCIHPSTMRLVEHFFLRLNWTCWYIHDYPWAVWAIAVMCI